MNKKAIGFVITALLVGTMVVLMVQSNINETAPIEQPVSNPIEVEEPEDIGLEIGQIPPDFELATLTGETVTLSELKGKKVMLNFWASWCGPCKAEMPHMEQYYKKQKESDGVEVIAVNLTKAERKGLEAVEQFVEAYGLTFPIPLDEDGKLMQTYEVITIPTTYLIGTDGAVAQMIRGPMDEETMKDLMDQIE